MLTRTRKKAKGNDVPVIDRGKLLADTDTVFVSGNATGSTFGVSRRDAKDALPGRPVPFGEPDPDRFARSDALRAAFEKGGTDPASVKKRQVPRHTYKCREPVEPREGTTCSKEEARLRCYADGKEHFFKDGVQAYLAMTGADTDEMPRSLEDAVKIGVKRFGWHWEKVRRYARG